MLLSPPIVFRPENVFRGSSSDEFPPGINDFRVFLLINDVRPGIFEVGLFKVGLLLVAKISIRKGYSK